jgi:hypothetical protein
LQSINIATTLNRVSASADKFPAKGDTKLNPAGTALVYSTYLGGGMFSHTVGYGIAVDAAATPA